MSADTALLPNQFRDAAGTLRTLRIDTWLMKRAKTELGVDVGELYTGNFAARSCYPAGIETAVDLAYLLLETDEDPREFARLVGPVTDRLVSAVNWTIAHFFDGPTKGAASRSLRLQLETVERITELALARSAPTDEELEALIDRYLSEIRSGPGSTRTPASSASTPGPSPSGSSS